MSISLLRIDLISLIHLTVIFQYSRLVRIYRRLANNSWSSWKKEWLSKSAYEEAYPYMIRGYYKVRFLGLNHPDSELDWRIPIKPKKKMS
ncbi:MAG: hypothetical protein ACFFBU_09205 [Promethearchaeota archaeon]